MSLEKEMFDVECQNQKLFIKKEHDQFQEEKMKWQV